MILSHRHNFVFIKGVKVAGTSAEIALSQICGEKDIITPITPRDERYRLGTGGEPRNYASGIYPPPVRRWVERRYVRSLSLASEEQIPSIRSPAARFRNHMWLEKVLRLVPEAHQYQLLFVERSPYAKVMSLANWKAHAESYYRGGSLADTTGALADAVDQLLEDGSIRGVLNIDRYRNLDGRICATPWKAETLGDDLAGFFVSRGCEQVPLVHAKRGLGSDRINPGTILRRDQISAINEIFAEEFERFDWCKLG